MGAGVGLSAWCGEALVFGGWSMVKSINEFRVIEVNGEGVSSIPGEAPKMRVLSHGKTADWVVIDVGGKQWTVSASDLRRAVTNSQNAGDI